MAKGQKPVAGFKKGKSGNPNGRPKGTGRPCFNTILHSLPAKLTEYQDPEYEKTMTPEQYACTKLLSAVQNGEPWAIKELLDRVHGKSVQPTENKHELDGPIAVIFTGKDRGVKPNTKARKRAGSTNKSKEK